MVRVLSTFMCLRECKINIKEREREREREREVCDERIKARIKGKIYKTAVRPRMM